MKNRELVELLRDMRPDEEVRVIVDFQDVEDGDILDDVYSVSYGPDGSIHIWATQKDD